MMAKLDNTSNPIHDKSMQHYLRELRQTKTRDLYHGLVHDCHGVGSGPASCR
jgi:hypothetical protein